MNNYLHINNNAIVSDLTWQTEEDSIKIHIKQDTILDFKANTYDKKIIFVVNKQVSLVVNEQLIASEAQENYLYVKYLLSSYAKLSQFIMSEDDSFKLNYRKEIIALDNTYVEISAAFLNDASINYEMQLDLNGYQAIGYHNLAALASNKDKKIYDIIINNNEKASYGELNNFGVVKDEATLIFNGTGYIKGGAKKSEAHQTSKIITFGEKVNAQANPFLIIDENDVAASHAAAVGKIVDELY